MKKLFIASNPILLALKNKLRFSLPTEGGSQGSSSFAPEDLYDLKLKDLDRMGLAVKARSAGNTETLLANPDRQVTQAEQEDELRLEVIKLVIADKQAENSAKVNAAAKRRLREQLTELQEKKKMEAMADMTPEQISAELARLDSEGAEPEDGPSVGSESEVATTT